MAIFLYTVAIAIASLTGNRNATCFKEDLQLLAVHSLKSKQTCIFEDVKPLYEIAASSPLKKGINR